MGGSRNGLRGNPGGAGREREGAVREQQGSRWTSWTLAREKSDSTTINDQLHIGMLYNNILFIKYFLVFYSLWVFLS